MKFKNIGIIVLILGLLFAIAYFVRTNSKSAIQYDTTTAFTSSIQKTSVVTGTVIPEDEVEIKPQLNGIISEIMVEEGPLILQYQQDLMKCNPYQHLFACIFFLNQNLQYP